MILALRQEEEALKILLAFGDVGGPVPACKAHPPQRGLAGQIRTSAFPVRLARRGSPDGGQAGR
jgi:hypothetical protein